MQFWVPYLEFFSVLRVLFLFAIYIGHPSRFNLDHDLEPNTEWVHKLTFLPPVCREGTRHSKYVSILWEILPQLTCGPSGATVPHPPPFCLVGQKLEVEVHSRR